MGETAFYVREKGDYKFCWQGMPAGMHRNLGIDVVCCSLIILDALVKSKINHI